MELLLLSLLVAIVWLLLLPSRIAGAVRRHRFAGAGILAVAAVGTVLLLHFTRPTELPHDYAQGDAALRAMLE
jgi:hypothetical protein